MLQAPSHLSRVCGHGHIKKFWLMQTQKESQACESKGSVVVSSSSPSRHANRASMKCFDSSQWSPPSPAAPSSGCGDVGAGTGKHSSFTCAASLRPHSCKAVPPLLPYSSVPNGGIEDMDAEEDNYTRRDGGDSLGRAPANDAHPSTSLSRSCSPNGASELESKRCHESALVSSEADQEESLLSEGCHRDNDVMSKSMKESPASNADKGHPHHIQHDGKGISPAAESMITDTHTKIKACSSPAHGMGTVCIDDREMLGDGKLSPSHRRSLMCSHVSESVPEKGKSSEATAESRTCYSYGDRLPQVAYVVQHPDLKACSLCGTTKTPMWRSGPEGPKSLCNACGIRFKKYRSFPGQSETCDLMMSPLVSPTSSKSLARPLKRKQNFLPSTSEPSMPEKMGIKSAVADAVSRQQKKSKWHQLVVKRDRGELKHKLNGGSSVTWNLHSGPPSLKKIYGYSPIQTKFKNLAPMDEHRTVSRVFAKDEEEAAVLLMHLSCGLVY